jgi:hypothetical protein
MSRKRCLKRGVSDVSNNSELDMFASTLPPLGHTSLKDQLQYPSRHVQACVCDAELKSRLVENLRHCPQLLRTQYSGMLTVEVVGDLMGRALMKHGLLDSGSSGNFVRSIESCDVLVLSEKVMRVLPQSTRPEHHFNDVIDRVPTHAKDRLFKIKWPPRSDAKAHSIETLGMSIDAVAEAWQVLQQVDLFNKKAKARCRKHHCECLLYTFPEESAYITMCWAGLTCLDVTVFGDGLGISGPSALPELVFMRERACVQEKLVVTECGPNWSGDASLREALPNHTIEVYELCPMMYGWAVTRRRKWTIANFYKTTMTFRQFCDKIGAHRTCMWNGTEFWCEEKKVVDATLQSKAKALGLMEYEIDGWESALTGAQRVYLDTARKMRREREAKTHQTQPFWIVDLTHHPESIDRSSKNEDVRVPCLLRHAIYWLEVASESQRFGQEDLQGEPSDGGCDRFLVDAPRNSNNSPLQSRLLLMREIVSLQGFATIPRAHGSEFLLPWVDDMVASFSDKEVTKLAGNAMHGGIIFLIWLWFLSCSVIPGRSGYDDQ